MSVRLSPKLRPGIWDALVVLVVILLAAATAFLVWRENRSVGPLTATISVDGIPEESFSLEKSAEYTVTANGVTLNISVGNGEVWVEASDCPTQDCVHTGHISRGGQSIVCLPARVIITLEGPADHSSGPDIVIG